MKKVPIFSLALALLVSGCGGPKAQDPKEKQSEAALAAPMSKIADETICDDGWPATISVYSDGTHEIKSGIRRIEGPPCKVAGFKSKRIPVAP